MTGCGLLLNILSGQNRTLFSLRYAYATLSLRAGTDIHTRAKRSESSANIIARDYRKLTAAVAALGRKTAVSEETPPTGTTDMLANSSWFLGCESIRSANIKKQSRRSEEDTKSAKANSNRACKTDVLLAAGTDAPNWERVWVTAAAR